MRSVVLCATFAALVVLVAARRSIVAADRSRGAGAAVGRQSARARDPRGDRLARADVLAAGRWPNPRVTFDRESVAGVTEYMTMVAQAAADHRPARPEVQAASALVDASSSRADDESGGCAPTCGSPSPTWSRRRRASAS